mgnify:CR=1 FL=1
MKTLIITLFLAFVSVLNIFAQDMKKQAPLDQCGTMQVLELMKQQDPTLEEKLNKLEGNVQEYLKHNQGSQRDVITIPVVVHIVYKTTAQNIPDSQIHDQIRILNEDFSKTNPDAWKVPGWFAPLAANCQINFVLANRDPKKKPTNGIIRQSTTKTSFTTNDDVKFKNKGGSNCWPTDKYLNIWICNIDDASGITGYAVFPGSGYVLGDGIVVDYQAFGISPNNYPNYNLGRTATHEVGHWLNLRHIWGDDGTECTGTDFVDDTPNQGGPNTGGYAVNSIIISCGNDPYGDMWMNYMNYTWHISRYIFTIGQAERMQSIFVTDPWRASLLTSNGYVSPNRPVSGNTESVFQLNNYPNPFNPVTVIRYQIPFSSFVSLKVYDMSGKLVVTLINKMQEAGGYDVTFDGKGLASGTYFYSLETDQFSEIKKMVLVK